MDKMIYLDSASTTPISEEVLSAMMPYLSEKFGNPNSVHGLGVEARSAVNKAREQVAKAINADPRNIIFTSSGSEANNMILQGVRKVYPGIDYISSKTEHTSSVQTMKRLGGGCWDLGSLGQVPIFEDEEKENAVFTSWATMIWMMYVNNEIGAINPVYKFGEKCSTNDIFLFGTDCVQALGFEEIDVKKMKCDFLTVSSHKIHGPKGVGAAYVKDFSLIEPLINGGSNQEFGFRGGTENVAGIVGFGKACEIATANREENKTRILHLRELFLENIDGIEYILNYNGDSKIVSLRFPGVDAETLVVAMAAKGVAISAGSACRNKESEPNSTLLAYGLSPEEARNTVRFSFMESLSEKEVVDAAEILKQTIKIITSVM